MLADLQLQLGKNCCHRNSSFTFYIVNKNSISVAKKKLQSNNRTVQLNGALCFIKTTGKHSSVCVNRKCYNIISYANNIVYFHDTVVSWFPLKCPDGDNAFFLHHVACFILCILCNIVLLLILDNTELHHWSFSWVFLYFMYIRTDICKCLVNPPIAWPSSISCSN